MFLEWNLPNTKYILQFPNEVCRIFAQEWIKTCIKYHNCREHNSIELRKNLSSRKNVSEHIKAKMNKDKNWYLSKNSFFIAKFLLKRLSSNYDFYDSFEFFASSSKGVTVFDRVHRSDLSMSFYFQTFRQFLMWDKNFVISQFSYLR